MIEPKSDPGIFLIFFFRGWNFHNTIAKEENKKQKGSNSLRSDRPMFNSACASESRGNMAET
jgi:hypothetical protein